MEHYLKEELYLLVQTDPSIFEFFQSGSLEGIWFWDLEIPENNWMSPDFWRTLGYDPEQQPHLTEAWQDRIFKEDLPEMMRNFESHCSDASHPYDQVIRYRHRDGSIVWVRCRGLAIRDEEGKAVRMLGAHSDITEQKRLGIQLQEQMTKDEKRNQYLADFSSAASHDLKAPLRRISAYLALIETELADLANSEVSSMMAIVTENANFLQSIVDDLLHLARLDTVVEDGVPIELSKVVEMALKQLSDQISRWEGEIELGELPKVVGIESLLVLLVQNLLSNAMIYSTGESPKVSITGGQDESTCWLIVQDNGIGIDEKYHEKIFGVFQRLHNRREYNGGSGIGLTICQRIVELHGGVIQVSSQPEKGTTMKVIFSK